MAAKNDITGDSIASRVNSKQYEDNFERIFGKKPGGGMSTAQAEALSDKPQNGDQRLNNLGKLESYYEGDWIVKEI
jgi:hypothetical protein